MKREPGVDFTIGFRSRQCTFITASSSATRGRRFARAVEARALVHGQFRKIPVPPFHQNAPGVPGVFRTWLLSRARLPVVRSLACSLVLARSRSSRRSVGRSVSKHENETAGGHDDGSASTRTYQPAAGGWIHKDGRGSPHLIAPGIRLPADTGKVQKLAGNPPPFPSSVPYASLVFPPRPESEIMTF